MNTTNISDQAELEALAQKYPERDSRGYVIGFYNYAPMGERESGPHATIAEAEEAQRGLGIGPYSIICGHIFTSRGKIVRTS